MDIPHEKRFYFRDGDSATSLEELKSKIERISYQEFYHHVNSQKNDFASWIRHVLNEERLADTLQKVTSIVETVEIINDHLHPRPLELPRLDAQSKIEDSIADFRIEQVPTVTPAPLHTGESTDIIIEDLDERASEELFPHPAQPTPPQQPQPTHQESHSGDMSRMIIKDFMYGLVFGLIVGLILGRMLSF